jgi:hypothetical protein
MRIAALILWVITALGGFVMLGTWIKHGGMRQQESHSTHFPAALILGHFLLAAAGLLVWIVFVVTDIKSLAWLRSSCSCRWPCSASPCSPAGSRPIGPASQRFRASRARHRHLRRNPPKVTCPFPSSSGTASLRLPP